MTAFEPLGLIGAWVLQPEEIHDERGFFARTWSSQEFSSRGMSTDFVEGSLSYNRRAATLRGMHYQAAPSEETKLVRCVRGAVYDVLVDLRPSSATFTQWRACELTAANRRSVYVPKGVAHGFLTLTDDTEVSYLISPCYDPAVARGVRWNDPVLNITWPLDPVVISARDRSFADFTP